MRNADENDEDGSWNKDGKWKAEAGVSGPSMPTIPTMAVFDRCASVSLKGLSLGIVNMLAI